MELGLVHMWAGLAIGLSGLGVAMGQGTLAQKAIEVLGKNPKLANTIMINTILGIALVESAVIYGLVVAFSIFGKETIDGFSAIAAGLAIGLTAFGAGFGEGKLVAGAMDAIQRNPEIKGKVLGMMILFLALVEVVAIYGLIVAFKILG